MTSPTLPAAQLGLLATEHQNMLSCVRCGQCLTSCPTYVLSGHESEGPRGRVAMARGLLEGRLELTPELLTHESNCLVCDACTAVCPAGVHMDPLQVVLRTAVGGQRRPGLIERVVRWFVFGHLFMSMSTFRLFVTALWLYQASGLQWLVRATGLLRLLGQADNDRLLPTLQKDFLVPGGETYASAAQGVGQPVVFFAGCVMSTALANTDRATIRVLQRWGFDVVNPAGQGCCGALHAHGGDLDRARELARRNIAAFEAQGDAPIVNNAAGCGAMLKDYAHHLRDDPAWADRARAFSARVKDLTEVLAGGRTPHMAPQQLVVTYQEPCHLVHAQRISQQPRALLKSIPGLQLREMAESSLCCGSAGVYNVTNPIQSLQLRERKLDNAHATGAEVIVTANPGCLMQLEAGLAARGGGRRAVHIADLLDQATSTS